MRANRKRVKEWLRQMDKEDYQRLLDTALFTPDEKEYIHMHCIKGMTFQQIYIDKGMSKSNMCRIAERIASKIEKAIEKMEK